MGPKWDFNNAFGFFDEQYSKKTIEEYYFSKQIFGWIWFVYLGMGKREFSKD
jgi:hypothetical protein